jgi:hypothetical protein
MRRAGACGGDKQTLAGKAFALEASAGSLDRAESLLDDLLNGDADALDAALTVVFDLAAKVRIADAAILTEGMVRRCPDYWPATSYLHLLRCHIAKSADDVGRVRRRWGRSGRFHPVDLDRQRTGPGYLLIRGYDVGFWGEVNHVATNMALADIVGREPVVYWGREVRYRIGDEGNAWPLFFEPVSSATEPQVEQAAAALFPGYWTREALLGSEHVSARETPTEFGPRMQHRGNKDGSGGLAALGRPEPVAVADAYADMCDVLAWAAPQHPLANAEPLAVYRDIFARRIRPRAELIERVNRLRAELFGDAPSIAVHTRGHGKPGESLEGAASGQGAYFAVLDRWCAEQPSAQIFLLTDVTDAVSAFRQRYGNRLVTLDAARISVAEVKRLGDVGSDADQDGYRLGIEVLIDAYLAACCDRFVGDGASGVSCSIVHLKDWPAADLHLVRRNVFAERHLADVRGDHSS